MEKRISKKRLVCLSTVMMITMLLVTTIPVFADITYEGIDPITEDIVIISVHCKTYADLEEMLTKVIPAEQARLAEMYKHIWDLDTLGQ